MNAGEPDNSPCDYPTHPILLFGEDVLGARTDFCGTLAIVDEIGGRRIGQRNGNGFSLRASRRPAQAAKSGRPAIGTQMLDLNH